MEIKCVVFDIDGTLITLKGHRLLDSTVTSIQQLQEKGIKVAVATGRPFYAIEKRIMERITFDYFICSNGVVVYDQSNRSNLFQYEIDESLIGQYTQLSEITNSALMFQFSDASYVYHGYNRLLDMINETTGKPEHLRRALDQKRHRESLPNAIISNIADEHFHCFQQAFPQFQFIPFMSEFYDVLPRHLSKFSGIEQICKVLNLEIQQVMAFGDALNDLVMIENVGVGIAMGDAIREVRSKADYVTRTSGEAGIYHALRHYQLI